MIFAALVVVFARIWYHSLEIYVHLLCSTTQTPLTSVLMLSFGHSFTLFTDKIAVYICMHFVLQFSIGLLKFFYTWITFKYNSDSVSQKVVNTFQPRPELHCIGKKEAVVVVFIFFICIVFFSSACRFFFWNLFGKRLPMRTKKIKT